MDGKHQNNIPFLPSLDSIRYENIFKLYEHKEKRSYVYNLIQSISFPDDIDKNALVYITITDKMPWTTVSYNAYKTIHLWWLICMLNKIRNPVKFPERGMVVKIIKPDYVNLVLREIQNSIKRL